MALINFAAMLLKGFGQIFFQDNLITGALIALGIFIASPVAFVWAVVGGATSALVNKALGFDPQLYNAGVAAFNGMIIGCAMAFYIKSLPISFVGVIFGSIVGGLIFFFLHKYGITPYAIPFIVVCFLTIAVASFFHLR